MPAARHSEQVLFHWLERRMWTKQWAKYADLAVESSGPQEAWQTLSRQPASSSSTQFAVDEAGAWAAVKILRVLKYLQLASLSAKRMVWCGRESCLKRESAWQLAGEICLYTYTLLNRNV